MKKNLLVLLIVIFSIVSLFVLNKDPKTNVDSKETATLNTKKQEFNPAAVKQSKSEIIDLNAEKNDSSFTAEATSQTDTLQVDNDEIHVLQSLDNLISAPSEDGSIYFNTKPLDTLNINEFRELISQLPDNLLGARASTIREDLNDVALGYQHSVKNITVDDVQCSDSICGFILSSNNLDDADKALEAMSSNEVMKRASKGGNLKIIEDNGIFYSIVIASISDKKLTVY